MRDTDYPVRRRGCKAAHDLLPVYKRLREKFPEWARKELPDDVIIVWNIGLTSRGGHCWWKPVKGRMWRWIEISSAYPRTESEDTLLHEMVHYALPPTVKHGPQFVALSNKVGAKRYTSNEGYQAAKIAKFHRRFQSAQRQSPSWER